MVYNGCMQTNFIWGQALLKRLDSIRESFLRGRDSLGPIEGGNIIFLLYIRLFKGGFLQ